MRPSCTYPHTSFGARPLDVQSKHIVRLTGELVAVGIIVLAILCLCYGLGAR